MAPLEHLTRAIARLDKLTNTPVGERIDEVVTLVAGVVLAIAPVTLVGWGGWHLLRWARSRRRARKISQLQREVARTSARLARLSGRAARPRALSANRTS